jgi:glycosyltransferase involved in cell wall biosynthesis
MKKAAHKKVAVVMPAYNEEARIGGVLKKLPSSVEVEGETYNLLPVVIDDKSQDNTARIAKKYGAHVIRHVVNTGAGGATRTGMKYVMELFAEDSSLIYMVTIDSDGQHDVSDIKHLISAAVKSDLDMVVGSRLHEGNKENMPIHRIAGNVGLSLISRFLFGIKTKDTQSGLRLYSSKYLDKLSDYTIDRYGFCTETLWQATRNGLKVEEVPIKVSYSAETLSKGQNNWGVVDLVKDLIWIRITR